MNKFTEYLKESMTIQVTKRNNKFYIIKNGKEVDVASDQKELYALLKDYAEDGYKLDKKNSILH